MMKGMLLVMLLATSAFAAGQAEPKRCCTSRRYTTKAAQVGARAEYGYGVPTQGYQVVVYDYDAKKLFTETTEGDIKNNASTTMKVLQDFNTMKQYITMEDGNCYYQEIKTPMPPPCVSENATYLGTVTLGAGKNAMKVQAWDTSDGHLHTKLAFDAENCTPVVHSLYGNIYGMDQIITYFYYDFQPDVTDSGKMEAPKDCKPQPTADPSSADSWYNFHLW